MTAKRLDGHLKLDLRFQVSFADIFHTHSNAGRPTYS